MYTSAETVNIKSHKLVDNKTQCKSTVLTHDSAAVGPGTSDNITTASDSNKCVNHTTTEVHADSSDVLKSQFNPF